VKQGSHKSSIHALRRTARFALLLALACSIGLHWALLQTVAWTDMIIVYSRGASLAEAISKTFDGKHPCDLCQAIAQGREAEKKQDQPQVKSILKLDCGVIWQSTPFHFVGTRARMPARDFQEQTRSEAPPKPRPRRVSADRCV
jgi:hypothetical protein